MGKLKFGYFPPKSRSIMHMLTIQTMEIMQESKFHHAALIMFELVGNK